MWFKNQPIGVHTLTATVKRLCEKAGIVGYKTNHSLRVTTATRLFQNGTDEQLIMERTGHRSTDGVRAYKRSCTQQQEAISKVLNREKAAEKPAVGLRCSLLPPSAFCSSTPDSCQKENQPPSTSASACPISLSDCSGFTINVFTK